MSIQRHCAHRKAQVQILKCASVTWGKVLDPPQSMSLTAKWGPKYCLPQGGKYACAHEHGVFWDLPCQ